MVPMGLQSRRRDRRLPTRARRERLKSPQMRTSLVSRESARWSISDWISRTNRGSFSRALEGDDGGAAVQIEEGQVRFAEVHVDGARAQVFPDQQVQFSGGLVAADAAHHFIRFGPGER